MRLAAQGDSPKRRLSNFALVSALFREQNDLHTGVAKEIDMGSSSKSKPSNGRPLAEAPKRQRGAAAAKRQEEEERAAEAKRSQGGQRPRPRSGRRRRRDGDDGEDSDEIGRGHDDRTGRRIRSRGERARGRDVDEEGKTEEAIEAERQKLAKSTAKKRGYRSVAKKAGFSAAVRLGLLAPRRGASRRLGVRGHPRVQVGAAAWRTRRRTTGSTEFEERTKLSLASLPPSAARVIRAHGETYLRRLVNGAFQRASDQQKTRRQDCAGRGRDAPAPARAEVLVRRAQGPHPLLAGRRPARAPQALAEDETEETLREDKTLIKEQKRWCPSSRRRRGGEGREGCAPGGEGGRRPAKLARAALA